MCHLFFLFAFCLSSNYALIFTFFFKTISIVLCVNFALLEFQVKYQVAKTLLQYKHFLCKAVVLGDLWEFQSPFSPNIDFQIKGNVEKIYYIS